MKSREPMAYRQRHGLLFVLFVIWVLSLPFQRYSIVSTYSIDNVLAPLICMLAIFLPRLRDRSVVSQRIKWLVVIVALYVLQGLPHMLHYMGVPDQFWYEGWLLVRSGFYFLAPAMYVRDLRSFRIMKQLIVVITVIGALSAFLVSIGVLHLEVERFSESRIGESWLPKSVGLFSNYGDLSILYGFVVVLLISHGRDELGFGMGTRLGKLIIWCILLLGLVGSQSRNMLFGTLIAMAVYWGWRKLRIPGVSDVLR